MANKLITCSAYSESHWLPSISISREERLAEHRCHNLNKETQRATFSLTSFDNVFLGHPVDRRCSRADCGHMQSDRNTEEWANETTSEKDCLHVPRRSNCELCRKSYSRTGCLFPSDIWFTVDNQRWRTGLSQFMSHKTASELTFSLGPSIGHFGRLRWDLFFSNTVSKKPKGNFCS